MVPSPNTDESYKERFVSFDLQNVQFISRPSSVFYIDRDALSVSSPDYFTPG